MSEQIADLLADFDLARPMFADFAQRVHDLITMLLAEKGLAVHSITSRVKTRESLEAKLRSKVTSYPTLDRVTDLAGVRVITYFANDVDEVGNVLEDEFSLDIKNSIDKRASIEPDRFGYLSLHYVARLSPGRVQLPEYRRFDGRRIEIQVRSILQHSWAEIEHDLGYKAAAEIPRHIRRRFSRVAGLLELADSEFVGIREDLAVYAASVSDDIQVSPNEVSLDKTSLEVFVGTNPTAVMLDEALAQMLKSELDDDMPMTLRIDSLHALGLHTIGDVDRALAEHENIIKRFAHAWITDPYEGVTPRGVSLFYLVYILLAERRDRTLAVQLLEYIGPDDSDTEGLVSEVFALYDSVSAGDAG